jgi:hypothetical protein
MMSGLKFKKINNNLNWFIISRGIFSKSLAIEFLLKMLVSLIYLIFTCSIEYLELQTPAFGAISKQLWPEDLHLIIKL